jgi:hypothetical protein
LKGLLSILLVQEEIGMVILRDVQSMIQPLIRRSYLACRVDACTQAMGSKDEQ